MMLLLLLLLFIVAVVAGVVVAEVVVVAVVIKITSTYPRPLWRPQPSTLLCQGSPNRLHRWGFCVCVFFFRSANHPFKSDRIINLLIAVAVREEEEEEDHHHHHHHHHYHHLHHYYLFLLNQCMMDTEHSEIMMSDGDSCKTCDSWNPVDLSPCWYCCTPWGSLALYSSVITSILYFLLSSWEMMMMIIAFYFTFVYRLYHLGPHGKKETFVCCTSECLGRRDVVQSPTLGPRPARWKTGHSRGWLGLGEARCGCMSLK